MIRRLNFFFLGSVGSIEATISSSLCPVGTLGVLTADDALSAADNQNEEAAALGAALQGTLRLQDLQSSPDDIGAEQGQFPTSGQTVNEFGASFWVDDMAGFPLPPLDLDPLPPGLFSPCSGTYK